ncbi:MAG: hypothetical protein H7A05_10525 [Pseudomonadales bacterium]|nr:hypothetical protein [Pseudomonadales bacterium]MCP5330719.1 hypothetical protein [Pseudomonadales bacterium]MCP5345048.1 hypothetical protein [Pseudomonadales bacterium]
MQKLSIGKIGLAAAFMLILAACSSNPGMRIGNTVTLCCPGNYAAYNTYAIEDVGLPIFLREYVAEEFDKAFQELGMTRNDARSDLVVNLNYRHVNLNPDQQQIDPFIRMESMNVELDYIANIDITMRERAGGKEVWAGTISRIHSVQPGEYMHEGNARGAFLVTFRDLLSEYPRNQE